MSDFGALRRLERSGRSPALEAGRGCALALALLCAVGSGCAGTLPSRAAHIEPLAANVAALDRLEFGMTRAESVAIMGERVIRPPWANDRGIGPQVVRNPFDTATFESPSGEIYAVDRYAIGLYGRSGCPFVRGEARLVPLIFLDGKLVGWRWSYLASAMQRPIKADEEGWSFGEFCGQASGSPD